MGLAEKRWEETIVSEGIVSSSKQHSRPIAVVTLRASMFGMAVVVELRSGIQADVAIGQ